MAIYPSFLRSGLMPAYEAIKGKDLLKHLGAYEQRLSWTKEQLLAHQWQELQKLLQHAYHNTQYYPRVWAEAGIKNPRDIRNMRDFEALPIVTKNDIKQYYAEFVSSKHPNNIRKSTGGSTGQPFHFELDLNSNTRREAVMWRGYGWLGAGLGQKTLYLWGADLGQPSRFKTIKNALYHGFYNRKMLNSFAMTQDNKQEYVDDINAYKPTAMVSYVNPLYELARYINDQGIKVWRPSTILTGAEPLHDFQREEIEKAFKAPVYNTFGCREFMLMGLANTDNGFTGTVFAPFDGEFGLDHLPTGKDGLRYFEKYFKNAIPMIPNLEDQWENNPTSALAVIRCKPYHWNTNTMLIGDAAHATVPFYGEGMNASLEDVRVFLELLDEHGDSDMNKVLESYTEQRVPAGNALVDLSLRNFIEMRDLVADPQFQLRKKIERKVQANHPDKWTPLYTLVKFTNIPYHEAKLEGERHDRIMEHILKMENIEDKWDSDEIEARVLALLESQK